MKQRTLTVFILLLLILTVCEITSVHAAQPTKIRLTWAPVPDAVMYELQIIDDPSLTSDGPLNEHILLLNKAVFVHGVEIDLAPFHNHLDQLWYRVRALDLEMNPISTFTHPVKLLTGELNPRSPLPLFIDQQRNPLPLYMSYTWVPVLHAASQEIEILSQPPDDIEDPGPSPYRVRSYPINDGVTHDCYDWHPYVESGTWWWRVIAQDDQGKPIGTWSKAVPFTVIKRKVYVAAYGDSFTHGGGAISSPPADPIYDWTYYVGYHVKNLAKSGDTSKTMVDRFDHDVLPFTPKVMLIMGGINDIRAGMPAADVINNLEQISQKCRDHGIIPVFVTLPPVNPERIMQAFQQPTVDNWRDEWMSVNVWVLSQRYHIDVNGYFDDSSGVLPVKFANDGLHMDSEGKRLIGQAVGHYLKQFMLF